MADEKSSITTSDAGVPPARYEYSLITMTPDQATEGGMASRDRVIPLFLLLNGGFLYP